MRFHGHKIALSAATVAIAVSGCSGTGTTAPSPTPSDIAQITATKAWTVDSSGWWVPEDPTGCLNQTTTCMMNVWPTRAYKGASIQNAVQTGATIQLVCKAPTPAPMQNSVKTQSQYWYYSNVAGTYYWVPDIYVTKDNTAGMAAGVPDCPSNTPGING